MTYASTTFILFGISGDLSRRKILPSLIKLYERNLLPVNFKLIGLSRKDLTIESIFSNLEEPFEPDVLNGFMALCEIRKIDVSNIDDFKKLNATLALMGADSQNVFYLSVPPETLPDLIKSLGTTISKNNIKILFEKPFGTSYASAENLIDETRKYFKEDELYHIDHYLAKQIVKDLIDWKSSQSIEQFLSNENIKKIEILSLESLGVEGRANFYDATGALRDLIQSHLLEMLGIFISGSGEKREDALLKLSITGNVRGQYDGYKNEVGNINSMTETFASVTYQSNDARWSGVPLTLTTGKAMESKVLEINITTTTEAIKIKHNGASSKDAIYDYEKILFDVFRGDKTIFLGNNEILATWKLIDPIIDSWSKSSANLFVYEKGNSIDDIIKIYENNKNK